MFDNREDEYLKATQNAQVNLNNNKSTFRGLVVTWNLFLLTSFTIIGYLGFNYLKSETTLFNDTLPSQTAVMGVSDTKTDREYLEMLNSMEMDIITKKELSLSDAIDDVINTSTIKDDSLYTQAISKEIDSKEIDSDVYHENSRVILVQKGDTLGSISEKFYGNPMEFDKIIEANEKLNNDFQVIHVGQKLNVPY